MKRQLLLTLLLGVATLVAHSQSRVIPIETAQKGYYITIEEDGNAWHTHFGEKIAGYEQLAALHLASNPKPNVLKTSVYPTFGSRFTGEPALKLTHADGNMTTRLIYDSHTTTSLEGGDLIQTEVTLRDEHYPITVTLIYKAYQQSNIITTSSLITNNERGKVQIDGAMSNHFTLQADHYFLNRYYGAWGGEAQMVESEIEDGITIIDSKRGVRTTQDGSPSFILSLDQPADERRGEVIIGSLAWSGNYKLSFEVNNIGKLHIGAGANDFLSSYTLAKGESFATPEFVLAHSSHGVGEASRNLHRWVRRYNIQDGDTPRPIMLNSWEGARFKFDEELIKRMIEDTAAMGVEMFVLDDGWFATKYARNSSQSGLGDWQINFEKLPNGLAELIECAEKNDIDFGLWFEPEMVSPKSELAEQHPEWIVKSPNRTPLEERNQLLLDLSNPKVKAFVHNVVAQYLRDYPGIKYIKWDANRHVEDFGSSYLARDKQSHFWIDYIRNLYDIYDALAQEFPEVIFQACSSGGGRVDYGSLKYHHEVWASDNTDAERRIFINWGLNQFIPAMAVASHVSKSPNYATKQSTPIKFRFDVAMAQRLGIELQPTELSPEELAWTERGVELYKERVRPIVQLGDQYRLVSPYSGEGFSSMIYVDDERRNAILFVYSFNFHFRDILPTVKLEGLDPAKNYRVEELLPASNADGTPKYSYAGEGRVVSGDLLMKYGMTFNLFVRYDSGVFALTEVE